MINQKAPYFKEEAYFKNEVRKISLDDYKGKWLILFFYPGDFTFVCPTELIELSKIYNEIKNLNADLISISTDSVFVHKAWKENSESINNIKFPMLSDVAMRVSRAYNALIEEEGVSVRASFIIDPEGVVKAYEFHNNDIGRSSKELLRKLKAVKFVYENKGSLCPVNWDVGKESINLE